ncbi:unnamed protein product [Symbiodinium microadriaticum]|nr:unnamed protein product [Symbiodinium microadriaticum]
MAEYVRDSFRREGITAELDPQKVLLTYPIRSALQLVDSTGRVVSAAKLAEDVLQEDNTSDTWWRNHTFNAFSPSGDVTAPVVYANFGLPEDFAALKAAGVDVRGTIALMRYGKCFRGLKAMNAQKAGALAAAIYSDPEQDGYAQGSVYPYGPWRPESSVQRGSIQFISLCAGDPTRAYAPHGKSVEELCGYSREELIPQIPVLPISYGDAAIFLDSLGGKEAPASFKGALNITYRTGPTQMQYKVRMQVDNHFQSSPVWNVVGKIPGTLPADLDQPVLLGNHRDAWVYGAADPNSGTAQLLEVAKGLGELLRRGWRPLRSIYLCSWSGEEYGLLGSTAWGEVNGDGPGALLKRALAYLNVDVGVSGAHFRAAGTPSLAQLLSGVLGQVHHPASQKPLSEHWSGRLYSLGSGSDYTVFIDRLGIPSLDMSFTPGEAHYGVYHSVYDSFNWMATEGDPNFTYHVAMSQVWGLTALRLAGSDDRGNLPLPLNLSIQAQAISSYIAEAKQTLNHTTPERVLRFEPLEQATAAFLQAADKSSEEADRLRKLGPPAFDEIVAFNNKIGLLERSFLMESGLPGRKWFRHCLQAPGLYTGYAAKTLPGITEAISAKDWQLAQAFPEAAESLVAGELAQIYQLVKAKSDRMSQKEAELHRSECVVAEAVVAAKVHLREELDELLRSSQRELRKEASVQRRRLEELFQKAQEEFRKAVEWRREARTLKGTVNNEIETREKLQKKVQELLRREKALKQQHELERKRWAEEKEQLQKQALPLWLPLLADLGPVAVAVAVRGEGGSSPESPRAMAVSVRHGVPELSDSFDLQMTLLALCKCLHESGQVPASRLAIELHKVRFSTMKQLHPINAECSFQRAMRSERILTQCVGYADRFLAIELFNTCKVLAKGLRSNPQLLPGVHLALGPQMWEWHPQPGTLRLLGDCIPRTQTFRSTLAQQRDVVVISGGGFGSAVRRVTKSASLLMKTGGSWENLPPMVKKREFHAAAFLNGKLYVCGGLNDDLEQEKAGEEAVHGSVECFDPRTKTWRQLPRMPVRRHHHECTSHRGCIFVSGGISPDRPGGEGPLATVECYDPSKQRWSQMPAMSTERKGHTAASVNGKLFACGGGSAPACLIEHLDDSLRFWVPGPRNGTEAVQTCLASTGYQGQLYILTHEVAPTILPDQIFLQRFNLMTGEWKVMPLEVFIQ